MEDLVTELQRFLDFSRREEPPRFEIKRTERADGCERHLIEYSVADGDRIPAFLLVPDGPGPFPAVLIQHQHNSEWHLGKSEVCGLAGDPFNAFGPALASKGFVVLAPDSIGFEDRRIHTRGTKPHEKDWLNYFNGMAHRLVAGKLLMTKVMRDSAEAVSLLLNHPLVAKEKVGVLGHSYGGNTAIFQAALDERIAFVCASGAACTYQHKVSHGTGLEMSLVIPGFNLRWDISDLVGFAAPRPFLIVSASEDPYSADAEEIVRRARARFESLGAGTLLEHARYPGSHALTRERFERIVRWVTDRGHLRSSPAPAP